MSDLVVTVRQISNYPELPSSNGAETLLVQEGGLGGPYASITTGALVSTALNSLGSIGVGTSIPATASTGHVFTATNHVLPLDASLLWNAYWNGNQYTDWQGGTAGNIEFTQGGWDFQVASAPANQKLTFSPVLTLNVDGSMLLPFGTLTVARDPSALNEVATLGWVQRNTTASFNGRIGAVTLNGLDVYNALQLTSPIATEQYVQQAITKSWQLYPAVFAWNGRQGEVFLNLSDITCVFFQPGQQPIAPTPPPTSNDFSIATTAWVTGFVAGGGAGGVINLNPGAGNVVPAYWVGNSAPTADLTPQNTVLSQLVVQSQGNNPTNPECTASFGMWGTAGQSLATSNSGQKVAVYAGAVQSPGSGPVWSLNTLVTRNATKGANDTAGGPGNIGSGTPGTPGAIPLDVVTIGYELDWNNFDQDLNVGSGFGVGMWINMLGSYPATAAIYMSNVNSQSLLNYGWHDGILFSGQYLIQDNTILDSTHSIHSYFDQGVHAGASYTAADTSPYAIVIAGNHTSADIFVADNAPTVMKVQGTHTNVIDVTGATIGAAAWNGPFTATRIDNTPIGGTTAAAGTFTTVTTSGNIVCGNSVEAAGTGTLYLGNSRGASVMITDPGGPPANVLQLQGNITGFGPAIEIAGSDTNVNLNIYAKGSGAIYLQSPVVTGGTNGQISVGSSGPTIRSGTGAATGTQPKGSMWLRTDGGVGSTLYIAQGGGTWNAVAGV